MAEAATPSALLAIGLVRHSFAEHHGMTSIATSTTGVLIARVALGERAESGPRPASASRSVKSGDRPGHAERSGGQETGARIGGRR